MSVFTSLFVDLEMEGSRMSAFGGQEAETGRKQTALIAKHINSLNSYLWRDTAERKYLKS